MIPKIKVYEPMSAGMLAIVNGINKIIDVVNKGGGSVPRDLEVDTLTVKGNESNLYIRYYDEIKSNNISTENYIAIESGSGIYMATANIFAVDIASDKHINPPIYIDKDNVIFNANGTAIALQDVTYAKYFKNIKINYSNINRSNLTKQQACQLLNITDKELDILCTGCEGLELIVNANHIFSNDYIVNTDSFSRYISYNFTNILSGDNYNLGIHTLSSEYNIKLTKI